jgi:protease-4
MSLRCLYASALLPLALAPLAAAGEKKPAAAKAIVAHIRLAGGLDEAPAPDDPLFGASGQSFKQTLERIRKARDDKNVRALYLVLDGLAGIGWAKVDELRAALDDFRKTGKNIYAFLASGDGKDYLVAVAADEVWMPVSGSLMLTGLQAEVTFYKELLDKLGIRADILWMGVYKFTGEPFTRTKMSPEARKQLELVLNDFYEESLVRPVSRGRSRRNRALSPDQVKGLIDQGPFAARHAAAAGLVDRVGYVHDLEASLKADLKADDVQIVRDYGRPKNKGADLSNPFNLLKALLGAPKAAPKTGKDRIALIYAVGTITTGKSTGSLFGVGTVGSTTLAEAIRQADKDKSVKAIVLRVDSPGGSALASDLIWSELNRCEKPVVASMSDTAASGGYYISMAARKIYAEPGTLTGSIGVVGGKVALRGLYDKVGVTTEVIRRGANAGVFSGTDPFSPSQRKAMRALMQETYDQFLAKAIDGRARAGKKFTRDQFLKLAEGRIWTGRQAKANGLVDELGTLEDAIAAAKGLAGLSRGAEVEYLVLPRPRGFLDSLLERSDGGVSLSARGALGRLAGLPELSRHLGALEGMLQLRGEPVWLLMPHGLEIR